MIDNSISWVTPPESWWTKQSSVMFYASTPNTKEHMDWFEKLWVDDPVTVYYPFDENGNVDIPWIFMVQELTHFCLFDIEPDDDLGLIIASKCKDNHQTIIHFHEKNDEYEFLFRNNTLVNESTNLVSLSRALR